MRSFKRSPHVGLLAVENRSGERAGDYLVRGLVNVDPENGSITIGDRVSDGFALQFQARDRETATADLDQTLALASAYHPDAAGALLYSCTGRGVHLFQQADHDVSALQRYWPDLPVAGGFMAGEIGPVCGRPYVHGLSACIGLLAPTPE